MYLEMLCAAMNLGSPLSLSLIDFVIYRKHGDLKKGGRLFFSGDDGLECVRSGLGKDPEENGENSWRE